MAEPICIGGLEGRVGGLGWVGGFLSGRDGQWRAVSEAWGGWVPEWVRRWAAGCRAAEWMGERVEGGLGCWLLGQAWQAGSVCLPTQTFTTPLGPFGRFGKVHTQ